MNVKTMSDISGVNIETIRSYRKLGYLLPEKLANGYYDYSKKDLLTLFWIRKLRGYTMSMDQISSYLYSKDTDELLDILQEKKEYIRQEIYEKELAMRFIDLEIRHIEESRESDLQKAQMIQSIDDKIDIYSFMNRSDRFRQLQFSMTPTVLIRKEVLNGPIEDRQIPIAIGMGTYQYILDEHSFERPKDCVVVPNGLNIVQLLTLNQFREINLKDLSPMMNYAKANGLTYLSDTTGYLVRIEMIDGKPQFAFRIRACVEKNNIKDPSVLARKRI